MLGIRCDVVATDDIYYLLFYDIDGDLTGEQHRLIDEYAAFNQISYIIYKTKNGYHLVGLTPLSHTGWSDAFNRMKTIFNSYYGGIVIRTSRKKDERQHLIDIKTNYGYVIPNLYNIYAKRFNLAPMPCQKGFLKHRLVFVGYNTERE